MGGCAGWIEPCVRVSQRRWSRIGGPGKSDCVKPLLTGKWGGGGSGGGGEAGEGARE